MSTVCGPEKEEEGGRTVLRGRFLLFKTKGDFFLLLSKSERPYMD